MENGVGVVASETHVVMEGARDGTSEKMDNAIGDGPREMQDAGDGSLEEIDNRVAEGSHGRKDSEGDEVFEEAQEHLRELQSKTRSEDVHFNQGAEAELAACSMSSGANVNSSAEQEVDLFEEAIGVPDKVVSGEDVAAVVIEYKMQESVDGSPVNEGSVINAESLDGALVSVGKPTQEVSMDSVGKDSTGKEIDMDESNRLQTNGFMHCCEDSGMDTSNVGGNGGLEGLKDEKGGENETDLVLEESVSGMSEGLSAKESSLLEESVKRDANIVKEDVQSLHVDTKCNEEILLENDTSEELKVKLVKSDFDNKHTVVENSPEGPFLDKHGHLADNIADLGARIQSDSNEEMTNAAATPDLGLRDGNVEEAKDTFVDLVDKNPNEKISGLKDITAIAQSGNHGDDGEVEDISNDVHASIENGKETSGIRSSPSLGRSNVQKEMFQAGMSDSALGGNRAPQAQGVGELEFRDIQAVIEEPKRNEVVVEKQSDEGNGKCVMQAEESVSGISESTAPPTAHPAGLGRAAPLLEPAPRAVQQPRVNGSVSQMQSRWIEDPMNGEAEEADETREKLQMIRVKFLRLAHRLGQTPHNVVVAQVLYRLGLAEQLRGRNGSRAGAFSFDRASAMAEQLEAAGQEPLDFSCTMMVLGKTGVGKSATINSIFDEVMFGTDAFELGTRRVQDVVGYVQGIKVRIIDTPGLLPSLSDQRQNEKILHSIKRYIKKNPPDIVLYLDRLDMQSREFGDMPLLRTITDIFGPSIWFNAIVVLTHAASAPPDGPNGTASSYEMFVTQRSHVVQQAVRQAAGDMRLMNPVSLVENHSACRTNRAGQRVLPNGQVWKPHLLLLSFASKILGEANTLLKLQDSPPGRPFPARSRAPPLPFLLSSLIQSRPQVKLPEEQSGDDDTLDDDLDESSDSDYESEYDELPPFKRLSKAQLANLTKDQKKSYFDELEYREKLFMKKQLKEEKKRRKMMKKMAASAAELAGDYGENVEEVSDGAASVPVPMPDLALPASFDSDNPTHRYRFLDTSNQWLVRPVLETHGWDHDVGYEGINVERLFVVKEKIPLSFSGQVTKDKKDSNLQVEVASSIKYGQGKATSLGLDVQTAGKDMIYTLRSETRFSNYQKNKATAGLSVTLLGDAISAGVKLEDKLIVNKRFQVVATGGAMTGRGDVAYGGSLEATLRDKDYPLGRSLSTLGLSVMDWHGDLAIGCNIQSQVPVGRSTNLTARANLNNRGTGQFSIRLNSSEQWQIVLVGLVPLLRKFLGYHQQSPLGQW